VVLRERGYVTVNLANVQSAAERGGMNGR